MRPRRRKGSATYSDIPLYRCPGIRRYVRFVSLLGRRLTDVYERGADRCAQLRRKKVSETMETILLHTHHVLSRTLRCWLHLRRLCRLCRQRWQRRQRCLCRLCCLRRLRRLRRVPVCTFDAPPHGNTAASRSHDPKRCTQADRDLRQRQEGEQQVSFGPVRQQREMRRGGRPGAPRPRGPRGLAPQRLRQCSRVAAVTITNQAY